MASEAATRVAKAYRRGLPVALLVIAATATLGALGALHRAQAAGLGMKPGLWEVRLVRQIVDGHDVSAQLTESVAKTQTALANLAPEARARAQAMFHRNGDSGGNSSFRICLSPEMAASDLPVLDQEERCRPVLLTRSGHATTFRIECTANGTQVKGRGRAVSAGTLISAQSDVTTRAADGSTHTLHNEMQMQYLGADCGKLLPPGPSVAAPARP